MKKYLLCVIALAIAFTYGCGRRNNIAAGHDSHSSHFHQDGESCEDGHGNETHSHDSHAGHDHAKEESCSGGHAVNSHDPHAGHDHSGDNKSKKSKKSSVADDGHDHDAEADNPDEIVFPKAQAERTEFEVQPAAKGRFTEVIKCSGEISAAQSQISVVTAPIAGVVTFVDGRIMASTDVRHGQPLFHISSGSLASGDAALKAGIAFEQAKADWERAQRLYASKIISQSDYLAAQAEYLRAESEYKPVSDRNADGSITVSSPAAGYLSQVSVSSGDYVEMGQPLAIVARPGKMQLRALVSQRYFDRLPGINDANFTVPSSSESYNIRSLGGQLYAAGKIVSKNSSLIPVVFEFENNGMVADGMIADVALLGVTRNDVMTLPISAITEQQGLYYVYMQLDEEHYSRREVKLGPDDGRRVEILSGIGEGDMIVTKGAINVRMAAASGSIPHGHAH